MRNPKRRIIPYPKGPTVTTPTAAIDALFAEWDKPDSPGCALAVIRDGEITYQRGYGMADLENNTPITPDSVFYIASVSKQFTAASVLLLAQSGALSLDDEIHRYFPELPDYGTPITIRHLLHHTSGLRDYLDLWELAGRSFDDPFTNQDGLKLLIRQRGLNFPPGEQHLYCNSGYKLLAELPPRVAKLTLRQYADQHIFQPLGMKNTFFDDDNAEIPNRVRSYKPTDDHFEEIPKNFTIVGSGGLLTTIGDLLQWDRNFYDPQVGGRDFVEQLQTPGMLNDGTRLDYAAGLVVGCYKGLKTVQHSGGMLGFRTHMLRFPDQRFTVICLGNLSSFDSDKQATAIADLYLADSYHLDEYAGSFYSEELDVTYELAVEPPDLVLRSPSSLANPLRATEPDKFTAVGRELTFTRNHEGRVTDFTLNGGRAKGMLFSRRES
jgi:CubicO group peptidase (beta-lactamase class C family)